MTSKEVIFYLLFTLPKSDERRSVLVIEDLIKHPVPGITVRALKLSMNHGVSLMGTYLLILHTCAYDPSGYCGASNKELAAATKQSIRTIGYQLKQLEMLELIKIRRLNQYIRHIECFETERMKRYIDKQKGLQEPDWMDEYMQDLAKVQG